MNITVPSYIYTSSNINQLPNKNLNKNKKTPSPIENDIKYNKKGKIIKSRAKKNMDQDWKKYAFHFMLNSCVSDTSIKKTLKIKSKNKKEKKINYNNIFINQLNNLKNEENVQILNEQSLNNNQTELEPKHIPLINHQTQLLNQNIIQELTHTLQNNQSIMQTFLNYVNVFFNNQNSSFINDQMYTNNNNNNNNSFGIHDLTNENINLINNSESNLLNFTQQQNLDSSNYEHPNINEHSNPYNQNFHLHNYFNNSNT